MGNPVAAKGSAARPAPVRGAGAITDVDARAVCKVRALSVGALRRSSIAEQSQGRRRDFDVTAFKAAPAQGTPLAIKTCPQIIAPQKQKGPPMGQASQRG